MSPTQFATLVAEALKLSPEERVLLVDHLPASVSAHGEIEEAWALRSRAVCLKSSPITPSSCQLSKQSSGPGRRFRDDFVGRLHSHARWNRENSDS